MGLRSNRGFSLGALSSNTSSSDVWFFDALLVDDLVLPGFGSGFTSAAEIGFFTQPFEEEECPGAESREAAWPGEWFGWLPGGLHFKPTKQSVPGVSKGCFLEVFKYLRASKTHSFVTPGSEIL